MAAETKSVWLNCAQCKRKVSKEFWSKNLSVCPSCGYHGRWPARTRLESLVDEGSFTELDTELASINPIGWSAMDKPYTQLLQEATQKTGSPESYIYGRAKIGGRDVMIGAFDFAYMGGTLGSVAGEKLARQMEFGASHGIPVFVFTASGGARMQEGMVSLMQMAKITVSIAQLNQAGVPLITVLCDPTTGGVAASLAFQGDIVLSEPGALIGFAGPRVILETIGEQMPSDVQRAERLCDSGFVDDIVERQILRQRLLEIRRKLD